MQHSFRISAKLYRLQYAGAQRKRRPKLGRIGTVCAAEAGGVDERHGWSVGRPLVAGDGVVDADDASVAVPGHVASVDHERHGPAVMRRSPRWPSVDRQRHDEGLALVRPHEHGVMKAVADVDQVLPLIALNEPGVERMCTFAFRLDELDQEAVANRYPACVEHTRLAPLPEARQGTCFLAYTKPFALVFVVAGLPLGWRLVRRIRRRAGRPAGQGRRRNVIVRTCQSIAGRPANAPQIRAPSTLHVNFVRFRPAYRWPGGYSVRVLAIQYNGFIIRFVVDVEVDDGVTTEGTVLCELTGYNMLKVVRNLRCWNCFP